VTRLFAIALAVGLAGCGSSGHKSDKAASEAGPQPKKADRAPDKFHVKFETTKGDFVMEVMREWAPRGADRFYELVYDKFYDGSRFFRVRPKFVVQFGISKDPKVSELWRQLKLPDDPVKQKNLRGYVSYAKDGPGSRTTQIFINLANNSQRLDAKGFAPFARVVEGMDVVDKLYATYGEVQSLGGGGPDPQKIEAMGEEYLARNFSRLDVIKKVEILDWRPSL
jgi:peptidyl-prolyl cis-trans isomerase A (cyclophilin A)